MQPVIIIEVVSSPEQSMSQEDFSSELSEVQSVIDSSTLSSTKEDTAPKEPNSELLPIAETNASSPTEEEPALKPSKVQIATSANLSSTTREDLTSEEASSKESESLSVAETNASSPTEEDVVLGESTLKQSATQINPDKNLSLPTEEDLAPEEISSRVSEVQSTTEANASLLTGEGLTLEEPNVGAKKSHTSVDVALSLPAEKETTANDQQAENEKRSTLKRSDPYSGYDSPRPLKKKRQRAKKATQKTTQTQSVRKYNDVIVQYTKETMPNEMQKYYKQRYDYFSKFDEGILMDKEGWFSVTPERIARQIADRCQSDIIIDAFCGCGGNSIQFAMTCHRVIAIDLDPVKLYCARENAKIYGVEDRIEFILGDFFALAPYLKADVVFLSPPWGGPSYTNADVFDLKSMIPGDGTNIFQIAYNITPNVAYFVPRNTDPHQLARLAGPGNTCEIQINSLCYRPKALTAYYGDLLDYQALEKHEREQKEAELMNAINQSFLS